MTDVPKYQRIAAKAAALYQKDLNVPAIALRLKVSEYTVGKALDYAKVDRRVTGIDREVVVQLWRKGLSKVEIGRRLGCTDSNVAYHLEQWRRQAAETTVEEIAVVEAAKPNPTVTRRLPIEVNDNGRVKVPKYQRIAPKVAQLYQQGLSITKVARQLHIGKPTVTAALDFANVDRRAGTQRGISGEAVWGLWRQGHSKIRIAAALECSESTVAYHLGRMRNATETTVGEIAVVEAAEPNATVTRRLHIEVNDNGRVKMLPGRDLGGDEHAIIGFAHRVKSEYRHARVRVVETITVTTVKEEI